MARCNIWFLSSHSQDDNENELGSNGNLSKSGQELKKLLRRAAGENESDADDKNTDVMIRIIRTCICFCISTSKSRGIEFMFIVVSSNRKTNHHHQNVLQNNWLYPKMNKWTATLLNQHHQSTLRALHLHPKPLKRGDQGVVMQILLMPQPPKR